MISILIIVIGIGGLIFVHELGHFLVAKWSGVKVEVFSVGFGWKFLSYKWGETQYALSIIPLGGYVKMAGELPNEERTGADYELHSKPAWKRFWIFSAGSLMNLLVVFPICMLMFWIGVDRHENQIGRVVPGSPEWEAGVESNTKLVGLQVQNSPGDIGNPSEVEWGPRRTVSSLEQYRETVLWLYPDQHVKLFFRSQDGNEQSYVVNPPDDIKKQSLSPFAQRIKYIKDRSPADLAGLQRGDLILSMNGMEVRHLRNIRQIVKQHVDPRLRYVIKRSTGETEIHEVAVERGTTYAVQTDDKRIPIYQLSDDLNVRERFHLAEGDRIVRINDMDMTSSTNGTGAVSAADDVQLHHVSNGPLSIELQRRVKEGKKRRVEKKTVSLYPKTFTKPKYQLSLLLEPVIEGVQNGSPADQAGLKRGDRIISVDGHPVPRLYHLNLWLEDRAGETLKLTYRRANQEKKTTIVPRKNIYGGGEIGVSFSKQKKRPAPLPELPEHSGFAKSGFQKGDRIVAYYKNGVRKDLVNFKQQGKNDPKGVNRLQQFLFSQRPQPDHVKFEVKRTVDGTEKTKDVVYTPEPERTGLIGLTVGPETYEKQTPFFDGITEGINRGVDLYALTIIGIQKMFQDAETAEEGLAGPVRIASLSYQAVRQDVGQFLKILAMISISLGILNLLPIPPLDGGHILFLFLEVLRGKPLGEEVLYKIQLAGFLFFILLFIVITYNDIVNVFGM